MGNKKTFKDFIHEDLDVFFNLSEMAEQVSIEGVEMTIVRSSNSINTADKNNQVASFDVVFNVASSYFGSIPQTEKWMNFDGEEYLIKSVNNNMGMLTIGLARNKS